MRFALYFFDCRITWYTLLTVYDTQKDHKTLSSFFYFTAMPENSQFLESEKTAPAPTLPAGKSSVGKKQKAVKGAYGKMTFRLLVDHEHALRLASILLERNADPIHTLQQMVDHAIERYTDFLQAKKNIDFQGILPKKLLPSK